MIIVAVYNFVSILEQHNLFHKLLRVLSLFSEKMGDCCVDYCTNSAKKDFQMYRLPRELFSYDSKIIFY